MKEVPQQSEKTNLKAYTNVFLNSLKMDVTDQMLFNTFLKTFEIQKIDKNNHVTLTTFLKDASIIYINSLFDANILKALQETFEKECTYSIISTDDSKQILTNKKAKENLVEIENNQGLNSNFSFKNYVEGNFNKEAIKIAQYIINDVKEYNPIFIYAKSGLGKTHLLHAIGNELIQKGKTVKYVNPMIYARDISFLLQENNQKKLKVIKDNFDNYDILLFDDFQNYGMGNKKATIQTIFNILDNRILNEKITIFCSDKPLSVLTNVFDDRLISRLSMGLQLEIKSPDQKDLLKVLDYMIESNGMEPKNWDSDAKTFVTRNFATSIRALMGAITRIKFYSNEVSKRTNSKYTVAIVHKILDDMQQNKENVTPETIIEYVARYYKIPQKEITGKSRQKDVVLARHIAIFVIRKQLEIPLEQIGRIFGNRDHSTILNAINKIEKEANEPAKSINHTIAVISDDIYRLK